MTFCMVSPSVGPKAGAASHESHRSGNGRSCGMAPAHSPMRWSSHSFRGGREVLIAEIRLRRPPDDDEAAICRLMARIARCGQAIEGCRELAEIAGCDRAFELSNSASDDCIDHVAHGYIVIARNQVLHVGKYFLQFAEFVAGERPVARLPREPQLGVIDLDPPHEFAKTRNIAAWPVLIRSRCFRRLVRRSRIRLAARGQR